MRICGFFDLSVFASLHRHRRLGSDPNAQDWRSRATRLVVVSLNFRMVAAFKLSSFFFSSGLADSH